MTPELWRSFCDGLTVALALASLLSFGWGWVGVPEAGYGALMLGLELVLALSIWFVPAPAAWFGAMLGFGLALLLVHGIYEGWQVWRLGRRSSATAGVAPIGGVWSVVPVYLQSRNVWYWFFVKLEPVLSRLTGGAAE